MGGRFLGRFLIEVSTVLDAFSEGLGRHCGPLELIIQVLGIIGLCCLSFVSLDPAFVNLWVRRESQP